VVAIGAGAAWFQMQQSTGRQEEAAKAKTAADAELAKARAETDAVKKSAADSAATAQRALEEQRLAAARARAQAELSSARAEADATRRQANAELASAAEARRAAETAAKAAAKPAAVKWTGIFACGSAGPSPPGTFNAPVASVGNAFELRMGKPGQPGSLQMYGTRQPDGRLLLSGSGLSGLEHAKGNSYTAMLEGKFSGERYGGRGKLGDRDCALTLLTPEAAAARRAAELAASPGPWLARFACAGLESTPPITYPATVTASGQKFELRYGKVGEPGSASMSGVRQSDGAMRITGKGISGIKEFRDKPFKLDINGKFSGERYEGRGLSGRRDCALTIARK
jgi:hypothetical protein